MVRYINININAPYAIYKINERIKETYSLFNPALKIFSISW
jgi:hypothetical protein